MDLGSWTYSAYLLLALIGTLAIQFSFKIKLPLRKTAIAILGSGFLFVAWDALATHAGHWSFGTSMMMGFMLGNQPIEEIAFFIVIPLFGLTLWEYFAPKPNAMHFQKGKGS